MTLEIKKKTGKITNMWRLNNMLLNNQWVNEEIIREIKNTLKQMKMEIQPPQSIECSKSSSKQEVQNNTDLPQETRNFSNK